MGLYDDQSGILDPKTAGILSAGFAALQASGPSRMPVSFGQAVGAAGQAGMTAASSAQQSQLQRLLLGAQVNQALRQQAMQEAFAKRFGINLPNAYGPAALNQPAGAPQSPAAPQGALSGAAPAPHGALAGLGPTSPAAPNAGMAPNAEAPSGGALNLPSYAQDAIAANMAFPGAGMGGVIMDANKPIAMRQGPLVSPTGQMIFQNTPPVPGVNFDYGTGGRVTGAAPIPGYASTVASIEGPKAGAIAGAKAEHETVNVKLADGREVPVLKSVVAGWAPPAQRAVAAAKPVPPGSVDPWTTMPKLKTPSGIGQSTYGERTSAAQAQVAEKLSEKYGASANDANQRMTNNNQALELVNKADTGPYSMWIADTKNMLTSRFGIPEKDFENSPSATLALGKDLMNAAVQKAKQYYGGRITTSEVNLQIQRGSPNTDMPTAAIKYLLKTDNALLGYQVQQANDLGKYLQSGGDPYQFEGWYAKTFPMTNAVSQVHLNTRVNIDDLIKKYAAPVSR